MYRDALAYAQFHRDHYLTDLRALMRIPSISTLSDHSRDMHRAAHWLVDKLAEIGFQHAKVMATAGHPVVYADWLQAGPTAPTLLVYGHYDVQPVDPIDAWHTPPFEPTIIDENLYGRGAADDKGQLYIHLAAAEAYLKSGGRLPLNLKVMLEGEEELGSPNLAGFVSEHQDLLKADAAVISDTGMIDTDTPAIVTSVRGLAYMEIFLRGSGQDLHSGMYGGVVENPLNVMVRLLASLHDRRGRIAIPGFYEHVREATAAERAAMHSDMITDETILAETGASEPWGEPGYTVAERKGIRPSLDIHGITGGFTGEGQKTVIPAVASAKVSMRLVPDQDPVEIAELFRAYILDIAPGTVAARVKTLGADRGAVVDISAPAIRSAAKAYERVFGREPVYLREGGSLPVVAMLIDVLHTPVAMIGFGLPDDNLHAPNEKFCLPNFFRGVETAIHYYSILATELKPNNRF
jgi:acetylornithine deacetylase/succinyl-diaminopimelate desuccinylase-like protein